MWNAISPGFSKWGRRPQMGSQAVLDGVARMGWGRAVKMQLKQNLNVNSMLTGLSYVNSQTVDNLMFCSLDPYLLCRVVAK